MFLLVNHVVLKLEGLCASTAKIDYLFYPSQSESWSEAEICKSLLDPKELFANAQYNCQYQGVTSTEPCFTIRLEIINQFQ